MATQAMESTSVRFMRRSLQVDGLVSAGFGLALTLGAGVVSSITGIEVSSFVLAVGLVALLYGAGLAYLSLFRAIDARLGAMIVALNIVWVLASWYLLLADPLTLTNEGRWFVLLQGDLVGAFAIWQYVGLRRMRQAGL